MGREAAKEWDTRGSFPKNLMLPIDSRKGGRTARFRFYFGNL